MKRTANDAGVVEAAILQTGINFTFLLIPDAGYFVYQASGIRYPASLES